MKCHQTLHQSIALEKFYPKYFDSNVIRRSDEWQICKNDRNITRWRALPVARRDLVSSG